MTTMTRPGRHRSVDKKKSFLIGLASMLDISGMATYRGMQDQIPSTKRRTQRDTYQQVADLFSQVPKR